MQNNISPLAIVFPGQGSQSIGMLADLAVAYPEIIETFSQASQVMGYDLWQLCQNGPEEQINSTEYAQPLLLTAGYAAWQLWKKKNPLVQPKFLAGHSLGEYTALVCSETIEFSVALKLVADRGRYMQEAVPKGKGAMVAIVGLSDEKVNEICNEARQGQVLSAANFNSIGQVVLAGEIEAAERAVKLAEAAKARLVKLLPVSVPSHCALMKSAADKLAVRLRDVVIAAPKIPVLHNADVASYDDPEQIRDVLVRQLYNPVRWVETILFFEKNGVTTILECGPGKVLTGLNKRIVSGIECKLADFCK